MTGIKDRRFPLKDVSDENILRFINSWIIILLLWLIEVYEQIKQIDKLQVMWSIVEALYDSYLDDNQKSQILGQIKKTLKKLTG